MGWNTRMVAVTAAVGVLAALGGAAVAQRSAVPLPAAAQLAASAIPPGWEPAISETSTVTIAPCRIVDTRKSGGKVPAGGARSFAVTGTTGFAPQGGTTGGCGIPVGATAALLSVTTTGGTKTGYFTGYPTGDPVTNGFVNISPGRNERASGTFALAASGAKPFTVKNTSSGPSHIVIDVQGYLVKPMSVLVRIDGTAGQGTSRVVSTTLAAPGTYDITFDRDVRACTILASGREPSRQISASNRFDSARPNTVRVWSFRTSDGTLAGTEFSLAVLC